MSGLDDTFGLDDRRAWAIINRNEGSRNAAAPACGGRRLDHRLEGRFLTDEAASLGRSYLADDLADDLEADL